MIETLGSRLKIERERLGLSQTSLAEIGETTKKSQIDYEKGNSYPKSNYLELISKVGIDVLFVVTGVKSPSEYELEIIGKHRAEIKALEDQQAFIDKALETANKFRKWSKESEEGLTFSTFVNTFGYQQTDANKMFSALVKIFDVLEEV